MCAYTATYKNPILMLIQVNLTLYILYAGFFEKSCATPCLPQGFPTSSRSVRTSWRNATPDWRRSWRISRWKGWTNSTIPTPKWNSFLESIDFHQGSATNICFFRSFWAPSGEIGALFNFLGLCVMMHHHGVSRMKMIAGSWNLSTIIGMQLASN